MDAEYQTLSLAQFCSDLRDRFGDDETARFIFFLGAGCSLSSGIPLGRDLALAWLTKLATRDQENDDQGPTKSATEWINDRYEGALTDPGAFYARVSRDLFKVPKRQQREIERITTGKFPGYGYALLAKLIGGSDFAPQTNIVLTTNFDDLLRDALYLYTDARPLVLVHEDLFKRQHLTADPNRPLIVKLHGDANLSPRNQQQEIDDQAEPIGKVLDALPDASALVFIGYSGQDTSTTKALLNRNADRFNQGIYWVSDMAPPDGWQDLWTSNEREFIWVKHLDFDAFMVAIADNLELEPPDLERARHLRQEHHHATAGLDHRFARHAEFESSQQALVRQQGLGRDARLDDLATWITDELWELDTDERTRLFVRLIQETTFAAEIERARSIEPPDRSPPATTAMLTERDLEDLILGNPEDRRLLLQQAEFRILAGDFQTAHNCLQAAALDRRLRHHPDLVGAKAYLHALSPGRLRADQVWAEFERAYILAPFHRRNLIRYLMVMLGSTERWPGLSEAAIWKRGRQLLSRYFDLPPHDDKTTHFIALYCVHACYRLTFDDILQDEDRPGPYTSEEIDLGPAKDLLRGIAKFADQAPPNGKSGWESDDEILSDEFSDEDALNQLLTHCVRRP